MTLLTAALVLSVLVGFLPSSSAQEQDISPTDEQLCSMVSASSSDNFAFAHGLGESGHYARASFGVDCANKQFTLIWMLTDAAAKENAFGNEASLFKHLICDIWHWEVLFDRHWTAHLDIESDQTKLQPTFVLSDCTASK